MKPGNFHDPPELEVGPYEETIPSAAITLAVPHKGELTFYLVASVPEDTDWEDVEGIMYELGGEFTGEAGELQDRHFGRVVLRPAEEGIFAVIKQAGSYAVYLAAAEQ